MKMRRGITVTLTLVLSGSISFPQVASSSETASTLATIPMSRQIDFTSGINGHTYRIQIAMPSGAAPTGGFPVVYVLDGDVVFGTLSSAARLRAFFHEVEPAVIVGIGYPDSDANLQTWLRRRNYDLTPTDASQETRTRLEAMTGAPSEFAGAETFLRVIEQEIKPRVAKVAPVASGRDTLFGHSFGGLFVLRTLFTHPEAFATYIALSPSIWWEHGVVLKDEAAFAQRIVDRKAAPRIFIGVGELEQTPSSAPASPEVTKEMAAKPTEDHLMVDNARNLAARLSALKGGPSYETSFKVFVGQTHVSVFWTAVNTLLDFALQPPTPPIH